MQYHISFRIILFAILISPIIVVFLQMIFNRIFSHRNAQAIAIFCIITGYIPYGIIMKYSCSCFDFSLGGIVYLFLIYSFTAYTYFHVFNMSETGRRIRMIFAIGFQKARNISDLEKIFNDSDMIDVRIKRLESLRQITQKNGRYYSASIIFVFIALILYYWASLMERKWKLSEDD